jgi:hypothetical protein
VRDTFARRYESGRELARSKGYRGPRLAELEEYMIENGVTQHAHAMQLSSAPPPSRFVFEDDDTDMKALIESGGQDDGVMRRMVDKALKETRSNDY